MATPVATPIDPLGDIVSLQAIRSHRIDGDADRAIMASAQTLAEIAPRDPMEQMLAAQMIAVHNAAMECYRRAMIPEQHPEARRVNLNQANKLSRTYADLVSALDKHRGKSQQKVTVEHVHVHEGGQAIVGAVAKGAGGE